MVWRDITIAADQTLEDLGLCIIEAFDFDNDHLSSFFLSGKAWDPETEYKMQPGDDDSAPDMLFTDAFRSIPDMPDVPRPLATEVRLRDLPLPG